MSGGCGGKARGVTLKDGAQKMIILEKLHTNIIFLLGTILFLSCSQADNPQEKLTDNESFMIGSPSETVSDCVNFKNTSMRLTSADLGQNFTAYSGQNCELKAQRFSRQVSPIVELAGIWNALIILKEGSSGDTQELYLYEQKTGLEKHTLWVTGEPIYTTKSIRYFEPQDEIVDGDKLCLGQEKAVEEWKRFGFDISLAKEMIFTPDSKVESGSTRCYALN